MILTILQNHIVTNAFSVRTGAGECLTLSVRNVASGDAESFLNVLREILNDVAGVSGWESVRACAEYDCNMKNSMSDRASAGKMFIELLYE